MIEEPPSRAAPETAEPPRLLPLSARTESALRTLAGRVSEHLTAHPEQLGDLCHTAGIGRPHLEERLALPAGPDTIAALTAFAAGEPAPGLVRGRAERPPRVAFLFTGQGAQHAGMGRELYAAEAVFRQSMDRCAHALTDALERPLLEVIFADEDDPDIHDTAYTQPALFAIEWSLYELWRSWGVVPHAVIGHSVGEYVAAVVAGVLSLEDGLALIAERGRLMSALPRDGAMAAAFADETRVRDALGDDAGTVSIAAVNGPTETVLSGDTDAVERIATNLEATGVEVRRLTVSHAFHSPKMDPILADFEARVRTTQLAPPQIPLVSNLTGAFETSRLLEPSYWRDHIRGAVRFADGMTTLYDQGYRLFVELGPHPVLTGMGRRTLSGATDTTWAASLRKRKEDTSFVLGALAAIHSAGAPVDWRALQQGQTVLIPTTPFERQRFWVDVDHTITTKRHQDWTLAHTWKTIELPPPQPLAEGTWAVVGNREGLASRVVAALEARGHRATRLDMGPELSSTLADATQLAGVLHLGSLDTGEGTVFEDLDAALERGAISVLQTSQALADQQARLFIVTRGAQRTGDQAEVAVSQAPVLGLAQVLALEASDQFGGTIDLDPTPQPEDATRLLDAISSMGDEDQLALRGQDVYGPRLEPAALTAPAQTSLSEDGTYLVTGGLGALGHQVARWLIARGATHLVLTARSALPDRDTWDEEHPAHVAARIAQVRELETLGATVRAEAIDVADAERMAELVSSCTPAIRGMVHAAGITAPVPLKDETAEGMRRVGHAKIHGAWVLHELSTALDLDLFVLFSSISAVWGSMNLASYSAANRFLDALADAREAAGLPVLAVNWGSWAGGGMVDEAHEAWLAGRGIRSLPPTDALMAMDDLLGSGVARAVVARIDWPTFIEVFTARRPRPLFDRLDDAPKTLEVTPSTQVIDNPLVRQLTDLPPEAWSGVITDLVEQTARQVMGLRTTDGLDRTTPLSELGMDSLMAIDLRNALSEVGMKVPVGRLMSGPAVVEIAEVARSFLATELETQRTEAPTVERATVDERSILLPRWGLAVSHLLVAGVAIGLTVFGAYVFQQLQDAASVTEVDDRVRVRERGKVQSPSKTNKVRSKTPNAGRH